MIRTIHRAQHHYGWDRAITPIAEVAPGDVLDFELTDASGGQFSPSARAADVPALDFARVNPVNGPIAVAGAEPGDVVVVELLECELSAWGWTAIIPGFGLLADQFANPYLHISEVDRARGHIQFAPGVVLPARPFVGTIGVAPAAPGPHSVVPPRRVGGNMDLRDLVRGATLYLPVEVPGALFSVGDPHAAQGDGEVCGTAVETNMKVRLRFGLKKRMALRAPEVNVPAAARSGEGGAVHITTGIGPDLMAAARDATLSMIDHLGRAYQLPPELAYCLCSVAVGLRISEIVDQPNWVVSAYLPIDVFH